MGTISQINKEYLKNHQFIFKRIEFERGLGIIDDAFFIEIESQNISLIIRITTNLRIVNKNEILLKYHDLFLTKDGNPISKRVYQSQKAIEKTLLGKEIDIVNKILSKEIITKIVFSELGDLEIILNNDIKVQAFDDLDIDSGQRDLYEILVIKNRNKEMFGIRITKSQKQIMVTRANILKIYDEKDGIGKQFILKDE